MIILYNCGDGGNRPQRGFIWGRPPPTRFYMEVIEKAVTGY